MIREQNPSDMTSRHSYRGRHCLNKTEKEHFKMGVRGIDGGVLRASKFLLAFQHVMEIALGLVA